MRIKTDNNFATLYIAGLTVYFSYETPIAFEENGRLTIRQNDWSTTTGKHLNRVNADKTQRISGEEFQTQLAQAQLRIGQ